MVSKFMFVHNNIVANLYSKAVNLNATLVSYCQMRSVFTNTKYCIESGSLYMDPDVLLCARLKANMTLATK